MSQRTDKVASLIHQIAAAELQMRLGAAELTVTAVDVTPDLRHATVWLGILGGSNIESDLIKRVGEERGHVQAAVAKAVVSKFTPRLEFRIDTGGEYAEHITKLIRN